MLKNSVAFATLLLALSSSRAFADITTVMNAWDSIPKVQISQGRYDDCGRNGIVYDGAMAKGYSNPWPGSGDQGDDICWRRSDDPSNPDSSFNNWTRCASSSGLICEIR
jgi:hypothetical protein